MNNCALKLYNPGISSLKSCVWPIHFRGGRSWLDRPQALGTWHKPREISIYSHPQPALHQLCDRVFDTVS